MKSSDKSVNSKYNPSEIEAKWQKVWEEKGVYKPDLDKSQKKFYNLMMFPYPSAEGMHVGNMYAFTGADVYGRFQRMQGNDVFEPIGLDGFGIHSENYAIKVDTHPVEQAKISEKNFYRQLRSIGNGFDWTRTVETYKPEYYKWTQWLFIQLFKAGLAYRKKAPVNFCPSCKTVLSDEQVIDARPPATSSNQSQVYQSGVAGEVGRGLCERCNSVVEKRDLEQWFFKITKYADRLLDSLTQIDWSEKVKIAQREWIGRSEGLVINFGGIDVFTTRPETADGATFLVLSPQHSKAKEFKSKEVVDYVQISSKKTDEERRKEKTGVFSGEYVINPLTKKKIPVWIADYVLMGYGTGAIMAVPAEDERDREFAEKYGIEIAKTTLSAKPIGKKVVNYHLRDWLISRQRYWGPPIPMIYCQYCATEGKSWFNTKLKQEQGVSSSMYKVLSKDENILNTRYLIHNTDMAGWWPVPEDQLPVELPFIEDYKPLGTGVAPLASHPEFYKTSCPNCGKDAKRETDVSDTFLDSAWYFLRYVSTDIDSSAFDRERVKKWLPVNMYIGGAEHSVLHLLYSRFITMVMKDLGHISFEEPFTKFRAHGLIVKDGAKMSKSKGNVVVPDMYIKKFGADSLRAYLMFSGSFSQGGDFRDTGIEGMFRFLNRVWNLVSSIKYQVLSIEGKDSSSELDSLMHKTIKSVTQDIGSLSYNTAIAHLMKYYNELFVFYTKYKILNTKYCKTLVLLLAPFAPHMTEELWNRIKKQESRSRDHDSKFMIHDSIHRQEWPTYDEKYLVADEVTIAIQVNGKLRGTIKVRSDKSEVRSYIEQLARGSDKVKKYLDGATVRKVIYIEGKVINFVVNES